MSRSRSLPGLLAQIALAAWLACSFQATVARGWTPWQEPAQPLPELAPNPTPPADEVAAITAELGSATAALAAATGLDESLRSAVGQLHQATQKKLDAIAVSVGRIAQYDQGIASAPAMIAAARSALDDLAQQGDPGKLPARVEEVRQLLAQAEAEREQARAQLAALTDEPARRLARAAEIPAQLTRLETELTECRNQLQLGPPPGEPELQTQARRLQLSAQRLAIERELEQLRRELSWQTATADLVPLQLELAQASLARNTARIAACEADLARREGTRLQQLAREVRREAEHMSGGLAAEAAENAAIADRAVQYAGLYNDLSAQLRELRATRDDVDRQFQTAIERYRSVGLTDALGSMLRQQRRDLSRLGQQNRGAAVRRDDVRELQVELFSLQDQLRGFRDDNREAELMLGRAGLSGEPGEEIRRTAMGLAARRRNLLVELQNSADLRFRTMVAVDTERRLLSGRIEAFGNWIDERVIWIPSTPPLGLGDRAPAWDAARWLVLPQNWQTVLDELQHDLWSNALAFVPFALGVLALLLFRQRLKRIIRETGDEAARGRCARMLPTFNSLAATILLAALWPMVLVVLGWTLMHGPPTGSFCHAVGASLMGLALFLAPLETLRQVCRERGLAECHFDWPERTRRFLMRTIRGFVVFALPLMFVQGVLEVQAANETWSNSLGRLAACTLFAGAAWFLHRVFRPHGTVFQQMAVRNPVPGSYRFRSLIHLVAGGMPLVLLVLAALGYFFTAVQLGRCLERTLLLLIGFIILGGVLLRWLLVRRRRLAMEEVRRMRLQLAAAGDPLPSAAEGTMAVPDKPALDLAAVSRQARELVVLVLGAVMFVGLWWIWRNVLPAIGILDQLELWQVVVNEKVVGVTVKHVFYAALTAAITWLIIRNMPGLLNLLVQQFPTLDAGSRYAVTTLFRYFITVIGAVVALSFLQIQWAQYGWLVAAVTVGLGFGLQEIVANFVSGLILLLNAPCGSATWSPSTTTTAW